jgi:ferredoxin
MALWFLRGVRRGVVTTRYPAAPEPFSMLLATPPSFVAARLDRKRAQDLASACPSGALEVEGRTLVFDVGACTCCGACRRYAPEAVVPSGEFELAATSRDALVKRIPLGREP